MKKILAIIFALVIIFSMSTTVFAAESDTDVSVSVDSAQISVTIPTDLPIGAKVEGGDAELPTEGSYYIRNNSLIPIKVDTIAVTLNDDEHWAFNGTGIAVGTNQIGNKNNIYLQINGLTLAVQGPTKPVNDTDWNVSAATEKPLHISCSTSKLNQTTDEPDLITIKYVVSQGTHPTT